MTDTNEQSGDATRLTLPPVDTSLHLWRGFTVKEAKFFAPAIVVGGLGLMASMYGRRLGPVLVAAPVALVLLVAGILGYNRDTWYSSARDRVGNARRYIDWQRALPWSHDDAVTNDLLGVTGIRESGAVEMADGRLVGAVRIAPTNTTLQTFEEDDALAAALGRALDEDIRDIDVTFHSTTRDPGVEEQVSHYQERVESGDLTDAQAAYLHDVSTWTINRDQPRWDPNQFRHYAVVSVSPWEVPDGTGGSGVLDRWLPWRDYRGEDLHDIRMGDTLEQKQRRVRDALSTVDGLGTELVDPGEMVDVVAGFALGRDHNIGDRLTEDVIGEGGVDARSLFAPGSFTATRQGVEVDGEHVRTYWIADYQNQPAPLFLKELHTAPGVDIDTTIRCRSEPKEWALAEVSDDTGRVDAEAMEREEEGDMTAVDLDRDIDAYLLMRQQLRDTTAQSWQVSAFVTVRADSDDALAYVDSVAEDYDDLRLATAAALEDACEDVERMLRGTPAGTNPVAYGTKQVEAFRSASPVGRNEFAEVASVDIERRMLGGAVGGMFPFCAVTPQEKGLDIGRNTETMQRFSVDPFERGSAPHLMTLGKSRSGKTFSVELDMARWYLADESHNLVLCDTQNGFHGITELLGGEHIVIDGQNAINPFDIRPIPEYQREAGGGGINPYRLKVEEATQFVLGILRSQGVPDPGEYASTIEAAIEAMYRDAGITAHDLDSHARPSPTFADFIDVLDDMLAQTHTYTFTEHERETSIRERRAANLLDRLSSFQEGGKYHHLVSETSAGLLEDDVDMAYLDLQQLQGDSDAEKSVMLHLALSQVAQKIKRLDGPTIFVIDEAHMLLHSPEQVSWLQKAAREWARYDAALHFVSQSPREFVESQTAGEENQRRTIVEQCSTVQFFYTELAEAEDDDVLPRFGLNERQSRFVREQATRGKDAGYSECLTSLSDYRGWFRARVDASPLEEHILNYAPHEGDGAFDDYLREFSEYDDIVAAARERMRFSPPHSGGLHAENADGRASIAGVAADGGEGE